MNGHQTDQAARRRLLDAQRAESQALRAVMTVERRKDTLQQRLDAVDAELAEAQATLASISGTSRATSLLGLDERELKQRVKRVASANEPDRPGLAGRSGDSEPEVRLSTRPLPQRLAASARTRLRCHSRSHSPLPQSGEDQRGSRQATMLGQVSTAHDARRPGQRVRVTLESPRGASGL